eukprot:gene50-biopygen609
MVGVPQHRVRCFVGAPAAVLERFAELRRSGVPPAKVLELNAARHRLQLASTNTTDGKGTGRPVKDGEYSRPLSEASYTVTRYPLKVGTTCSLQGDCLQRGNTRVVIQSELKKTRAKKGLKFQPALAVKV